jgi:hypothetical protein
VGWLIRSLVVLLLAAVGLGSWMLYRGVTISLQAEGNLHATLFTIRLVEQFVADNGRWPHSWDELEGLSITTDPPSPAQGNVSAIRIGGQHGYECPAASPEIRKRVSIDFQADPEEIARQDPMTFGAIKPIGPYYEYRDYGFVTSLQATIRRSRRGAADP